MSSHSVCNSFSSASGNFGHLDVESKCHFDEIDLLIWNTKQFHVIKWEYNKKLLIQPRNNDLMPNRRIFHFISLYLLAKITFTDEIETQNLVRIFSLFAWQTISNFGTFCAHPLGRKIAIRHHVSSNYVLSMHHETGLRREQPESLCRTRLGLCFRCSISNLIGQSLLWENPLEFLICCWIRNFANVQNLFVFLLFLIF